VAKSTSRSERVVDHVCQDGLRHAPPRDARWHRWARWAQWLSWVSLAALLAELVVGLWQGLAAESIALTGWALGSAPEGLASAMVVWRFSGSRTLSETAERRAQVGVALSFWLTAPYIAAESLRHLVGGHHADTSLIGIGLTAIAVVLMPTLGRAKSVLAVRLGSGATAGSGIQNYLCGAQAAAVLIGLALTASGPDGWWFDPAVGLVIAAVAVWQGVRSWRGDDCGC
jgi:divalent metal cation (Fe/Co/Zn/Cd) transporter